MRAAPASRRGRCAKVATKPEEDLPAGWPEPGGGGFDAPTALSVFRGGGVLGVPGPLSALGGGGDLGMRRPFGSGGGLPCPRRRRGSSGANGASPFGASEGDASAKS